MGTRSRIILRRSAGRADWRAPHVHFWMAYDGYFSGQGDRICKQLRDLLSRYSAISLQAMLDALDVPDLGDDSQNFSAEFLADFLEERASYKNDLCGDVEYEYTIDFSKGLLLAQHNDKTFVATFASIQDGFNVSELDDYLK